MQQDQGTSFGRIILTPILVMIAAAIVAGLDRNLFLPALVAGLVISVAYVLWASRRKRLMSPVADPATALGSLADLRDRGAISEGEYEAKKRDLLARM